MSDINNVSAIIKNGQVENTSSTKKDTAPKGYDKDSFLKILVAQMKYQNPMQPESNTEYISQYATFSQVEQLSNMANAMVMSRASEMVGKTVVITQKNADTGVSTTVQGKVDFVTYNENKAYVSVNGQNYLVDDVTEVLDEDYVNGIDRKNDFLDTIDSLPTLEEIDLDYETLINEMYKYYTTEMPQEQKNSISSEVTMKFLQYVNRIDDLNGDIYRTL